MRDYLINSSILAVLGGVNDNGIAWLVGALAIVPTILFVINQYLAIKQRTSDTPPPTEKYRHVKDCEHLCQANISAHEKLDAEMNERFEDMGKHSAQSREKLNLRLAQVESNLAALTKENEIQTQHIYSLEQKIDRFIERHK